MSEYAKKYKQLADRLSKLPAVTKYDIDDEKEAWTLAHVFLDLDEILAKFRDIYFSKLMKENLKDEELNDILLDIGEEFRHISNLIKDPKFYRYLFPEDNVK